MSGHGQEIETVLASTVLCIHVVYLHYEAWSLWKTQPIYCRLSLLKININIMPQLLCYIAYRLQFLGHSEHNLATLWFVKCCV